MNLSFEISLSDIGTGLELSGNSVSEKQEVQDFLISINESMDDVDFTRDLIYRLTLAVAEESEVRGWDQVPMGEYETFSQLYEGLSYMAEDKLITLMANAMMVKREREDKERSTCDCGHPEGVHNLPCLPGLEDSCHACMEAAKAKPLPLSTVCVCGHNMNYHTNVKNALLNPDSCTIVHCKCRNFREKQ